MPCHFSLPFSIIIPAGSSRSAEVEEGTFSLCWASVLSVDLCEEIQYPVPLLTTEDMFDTADVFLDYNFTLQNLYIIVPKKLGQVFSELTNVTNKIVNLRDVSPSLQNVFWKKHLCLQGAATISNYCWFHKTVNTMRALSFGKCSPFLSVSSFSDGSIIVFPCAMTIRLGLLTLPASWFFPAWS